MKVVAQIRMIVRRARTGEDGFSIIEVLIAAFILVLGSLAIFMAFAAAVHNVQRGRESQLGISVAQREMERVRVIPFDSIRLSSAPEAPFSLDPLDPYSRVEIGGARYDVVRDDGSAAVYEPLLVPEDTDPPQPPARVDVETEGVRSEDGTEVTVYRFVTCEEEDLEGNCIAKRVIIDVQLAAKANLGNYQRNYTELQSTIVDTSGEEEP